MYDFGKIHRGAGGSLNGPYMLKNRMLHVMEEMLQKYMSRYNLTPQDNTVSLRREFLHRESQNLIFALMEVIEKRRNPKLVTPEGHELKYCTGIFELKEAGASVRLLQRSPGFMQNDSAGEHVFEWIDPGSRIPTSPDTDDSGRDHTLKIEARTADIFFGKDGNKQGRIYGNIRIENYVLTLSAFSVERYHALKSMMHEVLGDQVKKELSERFENIEDLKKDAVDDESQDDEGMTGSYDNDDEAFPEPSEEEIQKELTRQKVMISAYYKWLDEKIPALDNMTPREAAKIPEMRERVEDLLRGIDYQLGDEIFFLMPMLRSELGLEEKD